MNRREFLRGTSATFLAALLAHSASPLAASQTKSAEILKRKVPSTGDLIPAVGLGTWQAFMPTDPTDATALAPLAEVLRTFFDLGGRVVDTAPAYGHAEQVVGEMANKLGITNDLFIATKVSAGGRDMAINQMNASLKKLRRDKIELMQIHNLADAKSNLDLLREWKQAGKFKYIGITHIAPPKMDDLEPDASRRLVVQKYIAGTICYQNVAAWQGRYLAGYAGDRLETHGGPMTPGTVVRYHDAPALREFSVQLVQSLGMTGLFTSEYIVEKATGLPYLIEINRRISPGTHYGAVMNVDLCAALHAAMHGVDSPSRSRLDSGEERVFVQFPAEWLRNPQSPWLRRHPVDVPWDDPELLDAMLALRNER